MTISESNIPAGRHGVNIAGKAVTVSRGARGIDGKSAYAIAVEQGFEGTEQEWISALAPQIVSVTESAWPPADPQPGVLYVRVPD